MEGLTSLSTEAVVDPAEALTVHRTADRYLDGQIVAAFGPSPALERDTCGVAP